MGESASLRAGGGLHSHTVTLLHDEKHTLSVEDSVLKKVRRIAVEQGTTVNCLVRRYLHELAG